MAATSLQEVEDVPSILLPCGICGRTFRPEVLSKHSTVCQRQHTKKRKKFDSAKQRIQGTDLAEFLGPPPLVNKPKPPSPKKAESKWKEKHEALVRSLRVERSRPGGGKAPGVQKEPPSKPSDHSQCPHCDRYFGPKAFDRHETWCREQHSKIQVQSQDVSKAKQRLEARTKYRAPCFKSQRSVTKEKYLPAGFVAKPPVSSNSSTLPSASLFPPQNPLRRNTSSLSASDFGIKSGGGGGTSPALVRRNSVPRQPAKQKSRREPDPEPLKKPQQTNLPTLFNTAATRVATGSALSEGSEWKRGGGISVSTETRSEGANNRSGSMGSPPPHQDQSKPVIKTSYSTNRKVKNGEAGTGTKRWRRRQEGCERSSETSQSVNSSVEALLAQNKLLPNQSSETGNKPRKGWARLKTLNSNPLMITSKTKKNKTKSKKPKHSSPVKSSSSHKTITLSDGESELHTLKELNKICEGNRVVHSEYSQDDPVDMAVSFNNDSYFDELENCKDIENEVPLSTSDDDPGLNMKADADEPVIWESDLNEGSETEAQTENVAMCSGAETSALMEPMMWTISFDSPCQSKGDHCVVVYEQNEVNPSQETCRSSSQASSTCGAYKNGSDQNEIVNSQPRVSVEDLLEEQPPVEDNCYGNSKTAMVTHSDIIDNDDLSIDKFQDNKCLSGPTKSQINLEDVEMFDTEDPGMRDCPGEVSTTLATQVVDVVANFLNDSESEYRGETKSFSSEDMKITRKNEGNNIDWKEEIKRKLGSCCECPELIHCIRNFLDLLLSCKGHNPACKSWAGPRFENYKLPTFKRKARWKASISSKMKSFSDSELDYHCSNCCFENVRGHCGLPNYFFKRMRSRKNCTASCGLSQVKSVGHLKDACCQTQWTKHFVSSPVESEKRLVLKENAVESLPLTHSYNNDLETSVNKQEDSSSTPRKKGNALPMCMGERLRDVRRLLSRSCDALSNDSLEEVGSTSNTDHQLGIDSHSNLEQNRKCADNEVVRTSVQRLFNTREIMNRRLALREQQMVNRFPSGQSHVGGSSRDSLGSGDAVSCFPHSTLLRLPPLGNSTHKRLNRRWSPSGDDRLTESANTEEDGAIGRFCHECGGRYPVPGAKFCCLCGVRRLAV